MIAGDDGKTFYECSRLKFCGVQQKNLTFFEASMFVIKTIYSQTIYFFQ